MPGGVLWRTFSSFAFSVVSSFPAFAACLFSCLAVNWPPCVSGEGDVETRLPLHTLRLKSAFSRPDMVAPSVEAGCCEVR